MPQLHFSVDERTAKRLQREARRRGVSLSSYLAAIVTRELPDAWPEGYIARVVGSCATDPLVEPVDPAPDDVHLDATTAR